jgi:starch synthase
MHIVMIAAENGALKGGKVGGIGDVIRDVPQALARLGHRVSVVTPAYGLLCRLNPSTAIGTVSVEFSGATEVLEFYSARPAAKPAIDAVQGRVTDYLLDHPVFAACGAGSIYCNDQHGPFATDAHKFSLFCIAVCQLLKDELIAEVDMIHLHDWHTAMFAILRRYLPAYQQLQSIPVVYTIHNLSLQGIRPLDHDASSLHRWFPRLDADIALIKDPRYHDCVNLMRAGIKLADTVHAVSPSYAEEILRPSDLAHGFVGGEGLEHDLQILSAENRLIGILNGCDYAYVPPTFSRPTKLFDLIEAELRNWVVSHDQIPAAHFFALALLHKWRKRRKGFSPVLTSVGRMTDQKLRLLMEPVIDQEGHSRSALECLLDGIGDGVLILLGSGDEQYEKFFTRMMAHRDNFLFLRGFSEQLAESLYVYGDLFLMPSSYEPCGISQMLAMRVGTPCIVHHVGGLRDTVEHEVNGFAFTGITRSEQAEAMLAAVMHALEVRAQPEKWLSVCSAAARSRFSWDDVTAKYVHKLYHIKH